LGVILEFHRVRDKIEYDIVFSLLSKLAGF